MADSRHGTSAGYMRDRCRCEDCRTWQRERMHRYYNGAGRSAMRAASDAYMDRGIVRQVTLAKKKRHDVRVQEHTRSHAYRHGHPWTEDDDRALVAGVGLTSWALALKLGRTRRAVRDRREKLARRVGG